MIDFEKYDRENPHIWEAFKDFSFKANFELAPVRAIRSAFA